MAAGNREVYIPDEMVAEIQTCLPVRSLTRFRCVSKSWNSRFQNTDFKTAHLRMQKQIALHTYGFFHSRQLTHFKIIKGIGLKTQEFWTSKDFKLVTEEEEIRMPEIHSLKRPSLLGISDYLVCLSFDTCFERHKAIGLWNPGARYFELIPQVDALSVHPLTVGIQETCYLSLAGFGYDRRTECHKVVKFGIRSSRLCHVWDIHNFRLYEQSCNSWKAVDFVHYDPHEHNPMRKLGLFETVVCQWQLSEHIFCFDVEDEVFFHTTLPHDVVDPDHEMWHLSLINGYPAVMVFLENNIEEYMKIWVLEGVGNDHSWVLRGSLKQLYGVPRPIGSKPSDLLCTVDGRVKIVKFLKSWNDFESFMQTRKVTLQVIHCVESMVPLYRRSDREEGMIYTHFNYRIIREEKPEGPNLSNHLSQKNENPKQARKTFDLKGLILLGSFFFLCKVLFVKGSAKTNSTQSTRRSRSR